MLYRKLFFLTVYAVSANQLLGMKSENFSANLPGSSTDNETLQLNLPKPQTNPPTREDIANGLSAFLDETIDTISEVKKLKEDVNGLNNRTLKLETKVLFNNSTQEKEILQRIRRLCFQEKTVKQDMANHKKEIDTQVATYQVIINDQNEAIKTQNEKIIELSSKLYAQNETMTMLIARICAQDKTIEDLVKNQNTINQAKKTLRKHNRKNT